MCCTKLFEIFLQPKGKLRNLLMSWNTPITIYIAQLITFLQQVSNLLNTFYSSQMVKPLRYLIIIIYFSITKRCERLRQVLTKEVVMHGIDLSEQKRTSYKSGIILNDWQTMNITETAMSMMPSLCSCRCFSKQRTSSDSLLGRPSITIWGTFIVDWAFGLLRLTLQKIEFYVFFSVQHLEPASLSPFLTFL
jgi:hypothetical protein